MSYVVSILKRAVKTSDIVTGWNITISELGEVITTELAHYISNVTLQSNRRERGLSITDAIHFVNSKLLKLASLGGVRTLKLILLWDSQPYQ